MKSLKMEKLAAYLPVALQAVLQLADMHHAFTVQLSRMHGLTTFAKMILYWWQVPASGIKNSDQSCEPICHAAWSFRLACNF